MVRPACPNPHDRFSRLISHNRSVEDLYRDRAPAVGTGGPDRGIVANHEGNAQRIHRTLGVDWFGLVPIRKSHHVLRGHSGKGIRETNLLACVIQIERIDGMETLENPLEFVGTPQSQRGHDLLASGGSAQQGILSEDIPPDRLFLWSNPGLTQPPSQHGLRGTQELPGGL